MNYGKLKWIAAPLALLSTFGWIVGDAGAFFGCFQRKMDTAASLYAGTGPCGGQRVVNYIPQTCYRVQYVQQAVTTMRPVCGTDPCTGCPVTTMKPTVCYRPAAQLVPYTTYRLVYSALQPACPTTATTYYAPLATCPQAGCGTGACGTANYGAVTAAYAPTTYAAPIATAAPATVAPAPGCSSCGAGAPTTYSSGYAPTTSSYAPPSSSYAPGYSSGARLGAPLSTPSQSYPSPSTPAATFAPGSTAPLTTVPGGANTVYSYGTSGAYPSSIAGPATSAPAQVGPTYIGPSYASPGYSGPAAASTIESQAAPVIVRSAPGAATIVGPSAGNPATGGTYSSGPASNGTYSSGTYSSGTATFAPSLTTPGGSTSNSPASGDGMTAIPPSTFMFPPMRGGPPAPSGTPSGTMPPMPTPMPGASPSPSAPSPSMRPIPDPEVSPAGPTLGRPAATTPLLIDPKDQTVFAWPSRRAWGYAPIAGRPGETSSVPVVAASYTTVDGRPLQQTSYAAAPPTTPNASPAVRLEAPVSAGDGWTRTGSGGGGWQAVGR